HESDASAHHTTGSLGERQPMAAAGAVGSDSSLGTGLRPVAQATGEHLACRDGATGRVVVVDVGTSRTAVEEAGTASDRVVRQDGPDLLVPHETLLRHPDGLHVAAAVPCAVDAS